MGWDIQINPTAEAFPITHNLVEILDKWAVDFDIRYCALEPDPRLIAQLSAYRPANAIEADVINRLLRELEENEDGVEMMLGH